MVLELISRMFRRESNAEWVEATLRAITHSADIGARRAFDAASTTAATESWQGADHGINTDTAAGLSLMRRRSRDLVRNYDYARGYMMRLEDNVLGHAGIQLQMRLTRRDGTPDRDLNDRFERAYGRFRRRGVFETSGKLSGPRADAVQLATLARDGELLGMWVPGRGPHRVQLRLIRPEILDLECQREYQGRRVRMGIEIDDEGQPVAYWLLAHRVGDYESSPTSLMTVGRHVRVPADRIIHAFVAEEPEQLRGVPWMSAGMRRLWSLKDYEQSAMTASRNAAKRLGFFVAPDGNPPPGLADRIVDKVLEEAKKAGKKLTPEEIRALAHAAEKFSTSVEGQFDTVPAGYDFRQYQSQYPHVNYGEYVREIKRGFASGVGMNLVTVGNDLESVNYSSARVGILDEREHFKVLQEVFIDGWARRVFEGWLPYGLLAEPLLARANPARMEDFMEAATFMPRRWAGIDPVKEETANDLALRNKLTSRARIIRARGDDPDEIDAEIANDPHHPVAPATASGGATNENDREDEGEAQPQRARLRPVS